MRRNGLEFVLMAALAGCYLPVLAQSSPLVNGKPDRSEPLPKPPPKPLPKPLPKYSKTVSYAIPGPGALVIDGANFQVVARMVTLTDVGTAAMSLGMAQGGTVSLENRGAKLTGPVGINFTLLPRGNTGSTEVFEIRFNGSVVATCNAKVAFNQAVQCRADITANGPVIFQLRGVSSLADQFALQSISISH